MYWIVSRKSALFTEAIGFSWCHVSIILVKARFTMIFGYRATKLRYSFVVFKLRVSV